MLGGAPSLRYFFWVLSDFLTLAREKKKGRAPSAKGQPLTRQDKLFGNDKVSNLQLVEKRKGGEAEAKASLRHYTSLSWLLKRQLEGNQGKISKGWGGSLKRREPAPMERREGVRENH